MIVINRAKAEAITWERIRVERDVSIAALDVEFVAALERAESTEAIAVQKQALRDVTNKDLSRLTIEQLSALTLDAALVL